MSQASHWLDVYAFKVPHRGHVTPWRPRLSSANAIQPPNMNPTATNPPTAEGVKEAPAPSDDDGCDQPSGPAEQHQGRGYHDVPPGTAPPAWPSQDPPPPSLVGRPFPHGT